jgi:hypothetical protein
MRAISCLQFIGLVVRLPNCESVSHGPPSMGVRRPKTLWQSRATSLNRLSMPTGHGKTWTAHRVSSVWRERGPDAYRSAEMDGEWLTMTEAAKLLERDTPYDSASDQNRRASCRAGCSRRPHQIQADDLASGPANVAAARKDSQCRVADANTRPMFRDT